MILSAGYGTRLWPLTEDRTKPAIPILGKPLVGYVAEYLARFGCDEIVVNLHHRPESVRRALGDGSKFGVKLHYVEEPEILGHQWSAGQRARVARGRNLHRSQRQNHHRHRSGCRAWKLIVVTEAIATLVLMPNPACEKFSIVQTARRLLERLRRNARRRNNLPNSEPPLMFTGIQILEPRIFDYIPPGIFSHSTTDVYPQAIAKGERVAAHVAAGRWFELSTIQRYLDISLRLLEETEASYLRRSRLQNFCLRRPSINRYFGTTSRWRAAPVFSRAILGDNVKIRRGESIENSAVVCASLIQGKAPPAKALKGEIRGDNFVVPLAQ